MSILDNEAGSPRLCADCPEPTIGRMERCLACATARLRANQRVNVATWRARNPALNKACKARWQKENVERARLHRRTYYHRHRERSIAATRSWAARNPDKVRLYAVAQSERRLLLTNPETIMAQVGAMLPRGMPGREDVYSDILLALMERRVTLAQLAAGGVRRFVSQFRRQNHEGAGYALSLDVPRLGGGSWHDFLNPTGSQG